MKMKRKYETTTSSVLNDAVVDTSQYETKEYEKERKAEIATSVNEAVDAAYDARDAAFANLHNEMYKRVADGQLTPEEAEQIIDRIWNLHQDPEGVWKDYEVRVKIRMQDKIFHEKLAEVPTHWYDFFIGNGAKTALEKGIEDLEKRGMTAEEAYDDVQEIMKVGGEFQKMALIGATVFLVPLMVVAFPLALSEAVAAGGTIGAVATGVGYTVTIGNAAYATDTLVEDIIAGKDAKTIGWDVFWELLALTPIGGAIGNQFKSFRNFTRGLGNITTKINNVIATKLGPRAQQILHTARNLEKTVLTLYNDYKYGESEYKAFLTWDGQYDMSMTFMRDIEKDARYLSSIFNQSLNVPFQYQAAFTNLARNSIAALPAQLRRQFTDMMRGMRNGLPRFSPEASLGEYRAIAQEGTSQLSERFGNMMQRIRNQLPRFSASSEEYESLIPARWSKNPLTGKLVPPTGYKPIKPSVMPENPNRTIKSIRVNNKDVDLRTLSQMTEEAKNPPSFFTKKPPTYKKNLLQGLLPVKKK
jgi:hypothetical protein